MADTTSPFTVHGLVVEFVRSRNRKRTISARLDGQRLIVFVPHGMSTKDELHWAEQLGERVIAQRRRHELNGDGELATRAQQLNREYFNGKLIIKSIRYVTNQRSRFGSCTPSTATIRLSDRVAKLPPFVRDAVIVHELCHLVVPDHSARFWALANRYPLMERARGYLMALGIEDDSVGEPEPEEPRPRRTAETPPRDQPNLL
jgi:hypothetical protein